MVDNSDFGKNLESFRNFCAVSNLNFSLLEKYAIKYTPDDTANYPFTGELKLIRRGPGYFDSSEFRDSVISQLIFDVGFRHFPSLDNSNLDQVFCLKN